MVKHVKDYDWSRPRQHAGLDIDVWIVHASIYMHLANDKAQRQYQYSDYIKEAGSESESQLIQNFCDFVSRNSFYFF